MDMMVYRVFAPFNGRFGGNIYSAHPELQRRGLLWLSRAAPPLADREQHTSDGRIPPYAALCQPNKLKETLDYESPLIPDTTMAP